MPHALTPIKWWGLSKTLRFQYSSPPNLSLFWGVLLSSTEERYNRQGKQTKRGFRPLKTKEVRVPLQGDRLLIVILSATGNSDQNNLCLSL